MGNKKIIDKEAKINNYKKKIYQIYDFRNAIKDNLNIIDIKIKKKITKNIFLNVSKNQFPYLKRIKI